VVEAALVALVVVPAEELAAAAGLELLEVEGLEDELEGLELLELEGFEEELLELDELGLELELAVLLAGWSRDSRLL
jgi:hypothetical protein